MLFYSFYRFYDNQLAQNNSISQSVKVIMLHLLELYIIPVTWQTFMCAYSYIFSKRS